MQDKAAKPHQPLTPGNRSLFKIVIRNASPPPLPFARPLRHRRRLSLWRKDHDSTPPGFCFFTKRLFGLACRLRAVCACLSGAWTNQQQDEEIARPREQRSRTRAVLSALFSDGDTTENIKSPFPYGSKSLEVKAGLYLDRLSQQQASSEPCLALVVAGVLGSGRAALPDRAGPRLAHGALQAIAQANVMGASRAAMHAQAS